MLRATVLPGEPASVAVDLGPAQIAACAHALGAARSTRFRLAEMSTDDVVALRELTAAVDQMEAEAGHGGASTIVLSAARLLLLAIAVRDFVVEQGDLPTEAARTHGRVAAELIDPLADLAAEALSSALTEEDGEGDGPSDAFDDDALDALLRGE